MSHPARTFLLLCLAAATAACGAEPQPPGECATPFECGVSEPRPPVDHAPPRFRFVPVRVEGLSTSAGVDVNDRGELLGDGRFWRGDRHVSTAFRFTEASGVQPIEAVGGVIPHALANDGTIAGGVSRPNGEQAVLVRGTAVTPIGDESTYLETQAYAINEAGQVAGTCVRLDDRVPYACRYSPGSGWERIVPGGVLAMAADGTVVGITGSETRSFLAEPGEEPIEIGVRSRLDTFPYGISPNGRYVVGMFLWPSIGPGAFGTGVQIDRDHADAPIFIEDTDDQPARDLHVQPFDVNDDGFAVGLGLDEHARSIGFLFDPRQGRSFPLEQLVESDEPVWIADARAISNDGYIAVTHLVDEGGSLTAHAALLVPIDWPTRESAPTRVADDGVRYDAVAVPDGEDGRGTFGVGLASDGRVLVNVPEHMDDYRHETVRPVWFDASSETLTPLGEVQGRPGLPTRVGRSGRAIGTGVVLDELVERYDYHAFLWAEGEGPLDAGRPEGDFASFGIDVDATGRAFGECFGPEGSYVCRRALDGTWTALFAGRVFAASEDGMLVGSNDEDALYWDGQRSTALGLGAGARALAISDDGAFVAGVHGHAFVLDVARDVVDWLPDALGAIATRGRVLPHAVNADGVVVGQAIDGDDRPFAFRYDPSRGTLVDLESRFEGTGIELHEAVDIDDQGRIVANGYDAEGTPRAYLLLPR